MSSKVTSALGFYPGAIKINLLRGKFFPMVWHRRKLSGVTGALLRGLIILYM